MRKMVFEMSYEVIWPIIFGRHANQVKVIEALKCLKCDQEGFAIICEIRLGKGVGVQDLTNGYRILYFETLYEEKDGSVVVFISGGSMLPKGARRPSSTVLLTDKPPEFVGVNTMKVSLVGEETELQDFLRYAQANRMSPKVLGLASLKPRSEPAFSSLPLRQKQALLAAYSLGYYDIPRRISSDELAKLLKIKKSALAEHLRKAERKMLDSMLAG